MAFHSSLEMGYSLVQCPAWCIRELRWSRFSGISCPVSQVLPVPALDPSSPIPEKHGVHFPGKQVSGRVNPHTEGHRLEHVADFGGKPRGGIRVQFKFDLEQLIGRRLSGQAIRQSNAQSMYTGIGFDKGCRNGTARFLFLTDFRFKCKGIKLPAQALLRV